MTAANSSKKATAVIFSFDDAFAPLGKGLVMSILSQASPGEFDLKLVDIGCSAETRAWFESRGVQIEKFDRNKYYPRGLKDVKSYQDAELCRPFIPELFPGYEIYLWCDADTWIQNIASLRMYRDAVAHDNSIIAISPIVDATYQFYYQDVAEFIRHCRYWYKAAYGPTFSEGYGNKTIFSAGVFGMHASNPIWKAWSVEVNSVFQRQYSDHGARHMAEQMALNYLVYSFDNYVALEAVHNYNCHIGCAVRGANGRVVLDVFPYREVGIIHLTLSGRKMHEYLAGGMLYESGKYLTEDELNTLRGVAHY